VRLSDDDRRELIEIGRPGALIFEDARRLAAMAGVELSEPGNAVLGSKD